jgi:hypothetical protein
MIGAPLKRKQHRRPLFSLIPGFDRPGVSTTVVGQVRDCVGLIGEVPLRDLEAAMVPMGS